jgi:hypothetical protein
MTSWYTLKSPRRIAVPKHQADLLVLLLLLLVVVLLLLTPPKLKMKAEIAAEENALNDKALKVKDDQLDAKATLELVKIREKQKYWANLLLVSGRMFGHN